MRLRPEIVALPAYKQGKPARPEAYKLSSNENPFEPLPSVLEAVRDVSAFNRYPDASALALREVLAAKHGVTAEQVHIGSGSVSILAQLMLAAAGPGDEIVYSWRSFEAYPGLVTVAGAISVTVPNLPDHRHDMPALAAAVGDNTRMVIICSPNNPTGTVVSEDEFRAFMAVVPRDVLVVLDEAYAEFVREANAIDGIPLLAEFPNLVVLKTFSKAYGLAGLRVGFAIGSAEILNAARSTAIPLSVTGQGAAAAIASLQSSAEAQLLAHVDALVTRRDSTYEALSEQGWQLPRPHGNFVWLPLGDETAAVAATLLAAGLVTRAFPPEGIRVSIGEAEAMEALLAASADIVSSLPAGHPARKAH